MLSQQRQRYAVVKVQLPDIVGAMLSPARERPFRERRVRVQRVQEVWYLGSVAAGYIATELVDERGWRRFIYQSCVPECQQVRMGHPELAPCLQHWAYVWEGDYQRMLRTVEVQEMLGPLGPRSRM